MYYTKYNEISIVQSDIQNHALYTGWHKRFLSYYGLCLKTSENIFQIAISSFASINVNFNALNDPCTVQRDYKVVLKSN